MLLRINETQELKQLKYEVEGQNCASEMVGSYGWDGFTPEKGLLTCSQNTFDLWEAHFEKLSKIDESIELFRKEKGFINSFEEKLLSKLDEVEFFEYPDEIQSFMELLDKGLLNLA
jgi:hypothetical protein